MVIDIPAQFAKLCPYADAGLTLAQQLTVVDWHLSACRSAGARGHWSYDCNRHLALHELRTAMVDNILARRAA